MEKYKGHYICECGKEFDNSQKFNGHKSACRVHLGEDKWAERLARNLKGVKVVNSNQKAKAKESELKRLDEWNSTEHYCEKCGKQFFKKIGEGRFCSRSCANSREKTDEIKQKTSESVKRYYIDNPDIQHGGWSEESKLKALDTRRKNYELKKKEKQAELDSIDGVPDLEYNLNRQQGYNSRKGLQHSYPELFWIKVLENNDIQFRDDICEHNGLEHEHAALFRLDFMIEVNNRKIDLEIDGEMHTKQDVAEKDKRRDIRMTDLGYEVYRIPWVNPNTVKNKQIVKEQIDALLEYLK